MSVKGSSIPHTNTDGPADNDVVDANIEYEIGSTSGKVTDPVSSGGSNTSVSRKKEYIDGNLRTVEMV